MPDAGYEHFDVEADIGVRAWGRTRAEAFAQAAVGVLAIVADRDSVTARETREVRAQADGPEALLVAWIDECLYVHELEAFVVRDVAVTACSDTVIHGVLHGEPVDPARHRLGTVVKGATMHGVAVEALGGHHETRLIVDV